MPDQRTLPIPAEHREFTVKVDGVPVPREHQLLSVSISVVANRIARARLTYLDGAAAQSDFPLSNSDLFKPGKKVEIAAAGGSENDALFQGVVVRHGLRMREKSAPTLVIECRHAAMKLTLARRNASYFDQTDSDVIEALLGSLAGQIDTSSLTHEQLVQFQTSDWDFIVSRAEATGKLVLANADKIDLRAPSTSGSPVATLQFGSTLLELDVEVDARQQYKLVRGVSWNPAEQALLEVAAEAPADAGAGNFAPDDLAAVGEAEQLDLRHPALAEDEARAWAESTWQRARFDKVSGRAKCEGIGSIHAGDVVALAGVGERFNGNVLVTGVRHEYDLVQGWKTHVQFGGLASRASAVERSAPAAGGLLPRVVGLHVGVVVSNEDPEGEHRVRVRLPLVDADDDGVWARVASLDAGSDRGFFFRPELGDEVVVGFFGEDPRRPVLLGMLHSSAKAAPLTGSDDNHEKLYKSRSGMLLSFDDENKVIRLETPSGNGITLSEADKSIVLADQNGNKIVLGPDGINFESKKALAIKSETEVALESGTTFSAKGGTELKLEGKIQAELRAGSMTKVSGGVVQIN